LDELAHDYVLFSSPKSERIVLNSKKQIMKSTG